MHFKSEFWRSICNFYFQLKKYLPTKVVNPSVVHLLPLNRLHNEHNQSNVKPTSQVNFRITEIKPFWETIIEALWVTRSLEIAFGAPSLGKHLTFVTCSNVHGTRWWLKWESLLERAALLQTTEFEYIVSELQRPSIIYSLGNKTLLREQNMSSRYQGPTWLWTFPFPTHTDECSWLEVQSKEPCIPFSLSVFVCVIVGFASQKKWLLHNYDLIFLFKVIGAYYNDWF